MSVKRDLAFLLGISGNLAFAAGNVALGINKYLRRDDYDIVVFHTDLSERDALALRKIPHVRLVSFGFPESFVNALLERLPADSRFKGVKQMMCFCHFEAFALLREYRNVVWLDADISIQASLDAITEFTPFGITSDWPWPTQNNFSEPVPGYRMDVPGVCTAVMLVNEALPYEQLHQWCYEKALEYAQVLLNPDQGIINLALQEFDVDYKLMPLEKWQCIAWREEANVATIVHFGMDRKVWNHPDLCSAFPEWYRTHLEWLKLGGSDLEQGMVRPKNVLPALLDATEKQALATATARGTPLAQKNVVVRTLLKPYLALGIDTARPGTLAHATHGAALAFAGLISGGRSPLVPAPAVVARQVRPPEVVVAIRITGGIGDHLLAARYLRDLLAKTGYFRFDIYSSRVEVAEWLFARTPEVNRIYSEYLEWDARHTGYPLSLWLTDFIVIQSASNWRSVFEANEKLALVCETISRSRPLIEHHLGRHPFNCNLMAREAAIRGQNRRNLAHGLSGMKYGGDLLGLDVDSAALERFGLPERYITVHNGTDGGFLIDGKLLGNITSTKVYTNFDEVVALLHKKMPGVAVVQIGAGVCRAISGVDLNLVGRTTMRETAAILGRAQLHVDGEGGLVHLAACMGVKSCVIFGPTSVEYFGYEGNANIAPLFCGDCWWLTRDWMKDCPRGFADARCLSSVPASLVAERVYEILEFSAEVSAESEVKTQTTVRTVVQSA